MGSLRATHLIGDVMKFIINEIETTDNTIIREIENVGETFVITTSNTGAIVIPHEAVLSSDNKTLSWYVDKIEYSVTLEADELKRLVVFMSGVVDNTNKFNAISSLLTAFELIAIILILLRLPGVIPLLIILVVLEILVLINLKRD